MSPIDFTEQQDFTQKEIKRTVKMFVNVKEYHIKQAAETAFQLAELSQIIIDFGTAQNYYNEAIHLDPSNLKYKEALESFLEVKDSEEKNHIE